MTYLDTSAIIKRLASALVLRAELGGMVTFVAAARRLLGAAGAPCEHYGELQAADTSRYADEIIRFLEAHLV